jgi:hypothetical protein
MLHDLFYFPQNSICFITLSFYVQIIPFSQPTNVHNYHLIHKIIFKNIKLLRVLDRTGQLSGSTSIFFL